MSGRCARFESGLNCPFRFLLGGLPDDQGIRFGGRNRSRTCDLFLVMEALVPTELCALVPGGLYRRFTVRRERWRYEGTAAPGQRRDHATRRQQAAHTEDDPSHAE